MRLHTISRLNNSQFLVPFPDSSFIGKEELCISHTLVTQHHCLRGLSLRAFVISPSQPSNVDINPS